VLELSDTWHSKVRLWFLLIKGSLHPSSSTISVSISKFFRSYADDIALAIAREKIVNTTKAGADCIATLCPFCFLTLDLGQMLIKSTFHEEYNMPVLHYAELLSLGLGIDPKELALDFHKIRLDNVLNKIS